MPKPKKTDLTAAARKNVRLPDASRLREDAAGRKKFKRPPTYKILGISVYLEESEWIDRITEILRSAGKARANRSMVVQEAIRRLKQDIKSDTPADVLRYFNERESERLLKS